MTRILFIVIKMLNASIIRGWHRVDEKKTIATSSLIEMNRGRELMEK